MLKAKLLRKFIRKTRSFIARHPKFWPTVAGATIVATSAGFFTVLGGSMATAIEHAIVEHLPWRTSHHSSNAAEKVAHVPPDEKSVPERQWAPNGADMFSDYTGPAGVLDHIDKDEVVDVFCRIPGNDRMPKSFRSGGWYMAKHDANTVGYIAANTFYNNPGDGLSRNETNNPYDSAVPACA